MESRSVPPGPYRATKLWNEITTSFRAGMPLRKHRQHFKKYGNCFTAGEAVDWLYDLLRNNNNFGPEVTRQQTIQLLRKFLKNHVIEDIKGRWGSENLDDNSQLFRFPANSPLKSFPRRHPELRKNSIENFSKDKDSIFKLRNLSRRTPKKPGLHFSQENIEKMNHVIINEDQENSVDNREISPEDIEEVWRYIILIYLQTILGVSSLEEVINPNQVVPQYIMYNMTNTSKHGIVILQDKSDDLPHWVLSAMKCLANWPRSNMNNPTYVGFERDVFRTIADYFLDLPEPLLTFEYYELFVSILVVCGYVTVSDRPSGIHKIQDDPQSSKILRLNNLNSFKSTECLLLSLLHKDKNKEESDTTKRLQISDQGFQEKCAKKMQLVNFKNRRASANDIMGGSCHNLIGLSSMHVLSSNVKSRCYSLEGIVDLPGSSSKEVSNVFHQSVVNREGQHNKQFLESKTKQESLMNLHSEESTQKPLCVGFKRTSTLTVQDQEELCIGKCKSKQPCRSQSLLLRSSTRSNSYINMPVAEIIMKPNLGHLSTSIQTAMENELGESSTTINKRLCKSTIELSENSLPPASSVLTGTQSLLQPHLERVAIDALQLCCLLLPPPNRRKLQLLMRMISRMSQNVDMPQLHDAMGTRSLMIHTFSRCVLCCAEEVDLDELLAARLVSFLMDHHQEILQVPSYLQTAVDKHLDYLKKGYIKNPGDGLIVPLPTYSYCKQISAQEFDEQKVSTSQAAIAELLENIIKNKSLPLKEKRKKLKQFQKEYPLIYQKRFPTTESEAVLFGDKPTIKQPMLILKKTKFRSLRY
ncbi:DEP domain-containing protein 1A isoform X1 [Lynx canadensis]|uniref:DEP domain-containing protein 1A n=2 Tax=Felinae TaxID=338152 RepID=A0A667HSX2_LYNCA|nr:DEP domain-containing protein 1A [Puma concolor]XP_030182658.1 DEP domain-containing protein 1A isoform X1 [Lynx canadensis]XP_043431171.1 DEP domain-containing protein 1A isoform X1 [Prionailurus bengalensis]XP_046941671.1 DEP domain-containing protein 1A isoform X1 [Lynx rufus]